MRTKICVIDVRIDILCKWRLTGIVCVVFTSNRSFYMNPTIVHQYTQCPSWLFILERYKLCGPQTETEKNQNIYEVYRKRIEVKQVKCRRTGYENTTKQAKPENRNSKDIKKKRITRYEMRHNTNDPSIPERLQKKKNARADRFYSRCNRQFI